MSETKPIVKSKINFVAILSMIAMPLAMFGIDLDPQLMGKVAVVLSTLWGVVTMVFRTFFTKSNLSGLINTAENVLLILGDDKNPSNGGKFKDLADVFASGKATGQWKAIDAKSGKLLRSSTGESDG
jgi:hypothetical protein